MPRVNIKFDANVTTFDQAVKGIKHGLGELKSYIAGALTVEALVTLTEKTFEYADSIDKASLRMKLTTDEVQALGIVAGHAGSSLEKIEQAFQKIELAKKKALEGDKSSLDAFAKLGLNASQLQGSDKLSLAGQLASAAGNGSTGVQGVALQELGLKKTSGDLAALGDSLKDFGKTVADLKEKGELLSDSDIANIAEAKDELEDLSKRVMAGFAPIISGTIEGLEKYYIIFKAYWSNLFAAVITIASDALEYLQSLPKAFWNSVTGQQGINLSTATQKVARRIQNDILASSNSFIEDTTTGLQQHAEEKAKRDEDRKKRRTGNVTDDDITPTTKEKKSNGRSGFYSDNLTSSGNLLGASFDNISLATEQLNITKQQLSEQKKQSDFFKTLIDLTNAKQLNPFANFS